MYLGSITCGQSYKAPTVVIYVSRVVNLSNLLVSTTLEWLFFAHRGFIRLATVDNLIKPLRS